MSKRPRIVLTVLGLILSLAVLLSACGSDNNSTGSTGSTGGSTPAATTASTPTNGSGQFNCVSGSLSLSGSTALQPYVQKVADQYTAKCSGAKITVGLGGSKKGLQDAESGAVQIGNSDVFANPDTQSDLVDHQVAIVIFAMAVTPDVTVNDIKMSDLQGIYEGRIKNWKEIGGNDEPITVISRPASSGTRATFQKYILDKKPETPAQSQALTSDSTGTVLQTIESHKGAIGYAALGSIAAEGSKLNMLKIDSKDAAPENVKDNSYKFWNIEHMYTKGAAPTGSLAEAFLNYMFSEDALTVSDGLKYVRIKDIPQDVIQTHNK